MSLSNRAFQADRTGLFLGGQDRFSLHVQAPLFSGLTWCDPVTNMWLQDGRSFGLLERDLGAGKWLVLHVLHLEQWGR